VMHASQSVEITPPFKGEAPSEPRTSTWSVAKGPNIQNSGLGTLIGGLNPTI